MIAQLLFATLLADQAGASADPQAAPAYAAHLLRPDVVARWQREVETRCRRAASRAECRPAYLAARYSEAAMLGCQRAAALPFERAHGGTATSFAQQSMRNTCRASIEFCRTAWHNFFRTGSGRNLEPRAAEPARWEQIATETCGPAF